MTAREQKESSAQHTGLTYQAAGVDIEAGEEAVRLIRGEAESTFIPGVLGTLGGFASLFALPAEYKEPVLVTATDGVGTKLLVAKEAGKLDTVGIDLVAMSVNDVLTTGARPVLFLDYVAVGRLLPQEMARLVGGVAAGCRVAGCALVGGEMAEMPGLYEPGEFDMAGFCVGLVERTEIVDGSSIELGDVVIGLASNGFHSNGYSLIRKVLEVSRLDLSDMFPGSAVSVAETLLQPTRIYVRSVLALREAGVTIHGMAHITGGGIVGNLSRVIPEGLSARLERKRWRVPPVFRTIQELGGVPEEEMFRTFNMGLGYVLVLPAQEADGALELLQAQGEEAVLLGEIVRGLNRVTLEG